MIGQWCMLFLNIQGDPQMCPLCIHSLVFTIDIEFSSKSYSAAKFISLVYRVYKNLETVIYT